MRPIILLVLLALLVSGCSGMKTQPPAEQTKLEPTEIKPDRDLLQIYFDEVDHTGKQLWELAVKEKVIPETADYDYLRTQQKGLNDIAVCIVYSREQKISLAEGYKRIFKLQGGIL